MTLVTGNLLSTVGRVSYPGRGHVEKGSNMCGLKSSEADGPETEKAPGLYQKGPPAPAAKTLKGNVVKIAYALG